MDKYIVAIDGPTSAGTSSTGQKVAIGFNNYIERGGNERLWKFVSAGSLYRAATVYGLDNGISPEEMNAEARDYKLYVNTKNQRVMINGVEIPAEELSTPIVNDNVAKYSPMKNIREFLEGGLGRLVREDDNHFIVEGRVMYKLFPEAQFKIYMTAALDVRAERRQGDFEKQGKIMSFDDVRKIVEGKDRMDMERELDPMISPEDAERFYDYVIDTTTHEKSEVVARVSAEIGKVVGVF